MEGDKILITDQIIAAEYFTITNRLRWFENDGLVILQQLHQGNKGTEVWYDVETYKP